MNMCHECDKKQEKHLLIIIFFFFLYHIDRMGNPKAALELIINKLQDVDRVRMWGDKCVGAYLTVTYYKPAT